MNYNKKSRIVAYLLSLTFLVTTSLCQPQKNDYFITAAEIGLFLYTQYGMHTNAPDNLSEKKPNSFDDKMRDVLKWNDNEKIAANYSDIFLYGLFVGSIPISPLLSKNNYMDLLLTNLEVLSINGLVTNLVKHKVKRQRPYSFYGTFPDNEDSYRSFFSGHTSTAFAIGTSTALSLTRNTKLNEKLIWGSFITSAILTGYLRIAADKHYTTDVIAGGIIGSLVGSFINKRNINRFTKNHRISFKNNELFIHVRL